MLGLAFGWLAGLYRTARVGLVTPLRDGMNLVAKEYLAAQDSNDPGVLILSRFGLDFGIDANDTDGADGCAPALSGAEWLVVVAVMLMVVMVRVRARPGSAIGRSGAPFRLQLLGRRDPFPIFGEKL
jgi:hypothetical protein